MATVISTEGKSTEGKSTEGKPRRRKKRGSDRWVSEVKGIAALIAAGFALIALATFDPTHTPNWNHTRQCDCPVQPGLWAVEPHVGLGAVGAKFEEILVVDERDASYLDDDLPHLRRWAATD